MEDTEAFAARIKENLRLLKDNEQRYGCKHAAMMMLTGLSFEQIEDLGGIKED